MSKVDAPASSPTARAHELAASLADSFREQVRRSLGVELSDESVALAFADHQLSAVRDEDREPIVSLVAASAGAWFGELVRKEIGGTWIGDGEDPRKLRLLLEPAFVHFSPVDLAYEAVFLGDVSDDDPRAPAGAVVDGAFSLDPRPNPRGPAHPAEASPDLHDPTPDAAWIEARLSELAPVERETYYSLTGRFETLTLILQMLAHRRVSEDKSPRSFEISDYLAALTNAAKA